ncbi:MAG: hypothetical protein IT204_15945 [Fimbriimonadaceae bacterium]|nr:hypothetical protein [Fimbriimonadaceae bacterium]
MSERVWGVPAAVALAGRPAAGFWREADPAPRVASWAAAATFRPRNEVESDETWRQIIPYILLRAPAGGYFTYRRLPASGEARLVDRHSIGVGGHINDAHLVPGLTLAPELQPNLLADGLQRELHEELLLPQPPEGLGRLRIHGFLALDESPVDRVHVGLVVLLDLTAAAVAGCGVRETDKLVAAGWFTAAELRAKLDAVPFEGWSRAVIAAGLP